MCNNKLTSGNQPFLLSLPEVEPGHYVADIMPRGSPVHLPPRGVTWDRSYIYMETSTYLTCTCNSQAEGCTPERVRVKSTCTYLYRVGNIFSLLLQAYFGYGKKVNYCAYLKFEGVFYI